MSEQTPETDANVFEIEVSDVDGGGRAIHTRPLPGLGARRAIGHTWRVRAASLVVLAALLLVVLGVPGERATLLARLGVTAGGAPATMLARHGPAPLAPQPVPLALLPAPPLASPPLSCPTSGLLSTVTVPFFGTAVGLSPVYVVGLSGSLPTLHLGGPDGKAYSRYGWEAEVEWAMEPGYAGQVTVSVSNLLDNSLDLLRVSAFQSPARSAVLDPSAIGVPMLDHWNEWISTLFLPAAGCYLLQARWSTGAWSIPFAAGR